MIHDAVIKAEIAAQTAAMATTKDEAWKAAGTVDFHSSVASAAVEIAIDQQERKNHRGSFHPSSFTTGSNKDVIVQSAPSEKV